MRKDDDLDKGDSRRHLKKSLESTYMFKVEVIRPDEGLYMRYERRGVKNTSKSFDRRLRF